MSLSFRIHPKRDKAGDLTNQETNIIAYTWTKVLGGKRKFLSQSTGIFCQPDNWNPKKQEVRKIDPEFKDKNNTLLRIQSRFADISKGTSHLGKSDLSHVIYGAFSEEVIEQEQTPLLDYLDYYIDQMPHLVNKNGGIGFSSDTVKQYKSFRKLLAEWIYSRNEFKVMTLQNVEMAALNEFVVWMNQKGFSPTTINKRVSYLKRIASFAVENGVKGVSGFFRGLKKPRAEKKEADQILFLTTQEMQSIIQLKDLSDGLENARRALIIQYGIAARIRDLLGHKVEGKWIWEPVQESNFTTDNKGQVFCHYTAHKTKKKHIIPIVDESVLEVIKTGLFRPIAHSVYNRHLKSLCRFAGINEIVDGNIRTGKNKVEKVCDEKWKYISSHDIRRTKISEMWNNDVPVRLILSVSGHRDENILKVYLGITGKQELADELREQLKK